MSSPAPPASAPNRPTREETRQRLLDGAYEAFCAVGFQAATIEDICARAGFTRGAFYSNFADKDELLLELWRRTTDRTVTAIRAGAAAAAGSDHPFEDVMEQVISLRSPDRDWFVLSTEFLLHALRRPDLLREVSATRARFRAELQAAIEELMASEGLRPPAGLDLATFTQVLVAGQVGSQHVGAADGDAVAVVRSTFRAVLAGCVRADPATEDGADDGGRGA